MDDNINKDSNVYQSDKKLEWKVTEEKNQKLKKNRWLQRATLLELLFVFISMFVFQVLP